jgi:uncharacterized delta-60 repeat protein
MRNGFLLLAVIGIGCGATGTDGAPAVEAALTGDGLDPSFGNGGFVDGHFGDAVNNFGFADAALDPSGNVVVWGHVTNVNGTQLSGVIVRYLPSGAPDPSFGSGGRVILSLGTSQTAPIALATQPDGKLLALAAVVNGVSPAQTVLLRLGTNGQLDATFGAGGQVVVTFPAPATFSASPNIILVQPDGKLLLAGAATPPRHNPNPPQTVLGRTLASGALDTSFASGGFASAVAVGVPRAVALLASGDMVVANNVAAVAQFSAAGTLLAAPTGGSVVASDQSGAGLGTVAFLPNAQYVIAKAIGVTKRITNTQVTRYTPQGAVDPSFSSPQFSFGDVLTKTLPQALAIDGQGRIVVGGAYQPDTVGTTLFGVARLTAGGSLDATFGAGGVLTTALAGSSWSVLPQPDGRIVSSGTIAVGNNTSMTQVDLGIVRYLAQ